MVTSQVAALNIIRSNPSLDITFSIINNSGAPILAKYPLVNNIIIRNGIPNITNIALVYITQWLLIVFLQLSFQVITTIIC